MICIRITFIYIIVIKQYFYYSHTRKLSFFIQTMIFICSRKIFMIQITIYVILCTLYTLSYFYIFALEYRFI